MDELLDIVDENNKPLGFNKPRREAHRDGDWHRTVHIYVVNSKGEFLVHLRSPKKDLNPSKWDTRFGGHLVAGSTVEDTAISELWQEIGIKCRFDDLVRGGVFKHHFGGNSEFNNVFYYGFRGRLSDLNFNDSEVIEIKWMPIDMIIEAMTKEPQAWTSHPDRFRKVIKDYQILKGRADSSFLIE